MVVKVKIHSNRLVYTTTSSATTLKKYNYNYSGALTSITSTNTSDYSVKIKSQWKYNSSSFLREYTEFDTTGFYLNYDCQSIYGLPISVSTLGSIWRYKYSMFGTREQKRLLYSPSGDSCSKQLGWVYYMQGAGGDTRTIYKGKQTAKDTLTDSGRRVYFWADKYVSVGGLSILPDSTKEIEIKDALGSVRATATVLKDLNTNINTFDYQPFGDSLTASSKLPDNAYIGMELDGERGQYHFNARSYDPQLSRFFAPDLLFELSPNQSPYSYSNNNPVNFKDPSGMIPGGYKTLSEIELELFNYLENTESDEWGMYRVPRGTSRLGGGGSGGGGGGGSGGGGGGGAYGSNSKNENNKINELFENFKATVENIYECYIHENVYAMFHPDATSMSASYSFTFGMGGGITEERFSFQVGDFAGQTYYSESGNGYVGVAGNFGGAGSAFWYFGNYSKFNPDFIQNSKNFNINVFNFSFSYSWDKFGNGLFGFSAGGGAGGGITLGTSNTTKFRRTRK
jgi:RHS repeat-associated protein